MTSEIKKWIALSFGFWVLVLVFSTFQTHPTKGLRGWGSDHLSHTNSGLLFSMYGYNLYRYPTSQFCQDEPKEIPGPVTQKFLCTLKVWGKDIPVMINWINLPRPYPPGVYFLHAPLSILKFLGVSEPTLAAIAILAYLFIAHLLLAIVWHDTRGAPALRYFFPILYVECIRWSISGFYDVAYITCLWMSGRQWNQSKPKQGLIWYCVALFLGFRALWFLPLGLAHFWKLMHDKRNFRSVSIPIAISIALASMIAIFLYAPFLKLHQLTNPIHYSKMALIGLKTWEFLPPVIALIGIAIWFRQYLFATCMGMILFFSLRTDQTMYWHSLSMLPLFVFAVSRKPNAGITTIAACFYVFIGYHAFKHQIFSGSLFWELLGDFRVAWFNLPPL